MPFDFAAEPDSGRDRLRALAVALRDEDMMRGWRWDYSSSDSCALGFAQAKLGLSCADTADAAEFFEIGLEAARAIFCDEFLGAAGADFTSWDARPGDVAERIEAVLGEPRQAELALA